MCIIKLGLAKTLFLRALRICDNFFIFDKFEHVKSSLRMLAYPDYIVHKALA